MVNAWMLWDVNELLGTLGVPILLVLLYFISHLPIYAVARFSVVLVPLGRATSPSRVS